jgi:autotransporter-associated beta strand protein
MYRQKNRSGANLMGWVMSWSRYFSVLLVLLTIAKPAIQAQTVYRVTSGGYLHVDVSHTPEKYNAGCTFYAAAWPLLGDYPRENEVQSGLYGTWLSPATSVATTQYTKIEGGLGWWRERYFQTATPKFIMGGVAMGNESWAFANGPGSGSDAGNGKYGIATLSPSLLFPPDGLNLRQGTNGELFGYGYLALPLTEPKSTTAGTPLVTGNHCWTLFLNTGNFKGPSAFYTPYFWSQVSLIHPEWAGGTLDTCWASSDSPFAMESQAAMLSAATATADATYVRAIPAYYPVDATGYSLLMHRLCAYDQGALWDEVGQWLNASGPAPHGILNPASTHLRTAVTVDPQMKMKGSAGLLGPLDWTGVVAPYAPNELECGYKWKSNQPSVLTVAGGAKIRLPEFYKGPLNPGPTSSWSPVTEASVPQAAAAALAAVSFAKAQPHTSVVPKTADPVWTTPGAASAEYRALLGDGSVVTYYWYRFADQPAILKADMTVAERDRLQAIVVKMHREWKNDRDYIAPPTTGSLADLDPGQLVTPPLGLEYGYVPIAWSQDWGGSVASPGSLKFTSAPATPVARTPFSVTVQAVNTSGVVQNVTSNTVVQLSVASGYGTLSGTIEGTIPNGSSSVTITGVSYSASDTMTLTASATCLSPGISSALIFTNSTGMVNIYNKPATGILTTSATLNAALDCRGTNAEVRVYWGIYNGGIIPAAWENSVSLGTSNNVIATNLSRLVTGLLPDTTYYFTFGGMNTAGQTWSSKVLNFTTLPLAPTITSQPTSRTSVVGSNVRFTVVATRAASYQWFKGAVPLTNGGQVTGANTAALSLSGVTSANVGSYRVVVTNATGQATSTAASLSIVAMSNVTWDANGTAASVTDGAGQWASNSWWNGTSHIPWMDNYNVQIGSGGTGGIISLGEVVVNNLTLSNFNGKYTLDGGVLTVSSNLTFESSNSATISSVIDGAGSLTKNGAGSLTLDGVAKNSYRGGTVINDGILYWGNAANNSTLFRDFACGTGPVTLNSNATIVFQRANALNAMKLNGGKLISVNGFGAYLSGPVTVSSNTLVQTNFLLSILGDISGPGGFTKTANDKFILGGHNTYLGATILQAGETTWQHVYSMSPGHLIINNGAMAKLSYAGTKVIANLTLGGAVMANGTYGSTSSPATNRNDAYFSGSGMVDVGGVNVVPVALDQSLTTMVDTPIAITLTGTDADEGLLDFFIVTQPTSGVLTGSGINWTYSPAANFTGVTSFTFKVNDGLLNSALATVSITILPSILTWKNAFSGMWTDNSMWLQASQASRDNIVDILNFNVLGNYTATNDLATNFQLNRLNFGGSTVTLAGASLTFVSIDNKLPTINQNSSTSVLIQNTLNLVSNTSFVGSGTGYVTASGLVAGSGGLTKNTSGTLKLDGLVPNTYSGGTTINSGILHLGTFANGLSQLCYNPAGVGPVILNSGGAIEFDRISADNVLVANGGTLYSPNGWGAMWTGPIILNAILTCDTAFRLDCSGPVSGIGGLIKNGSGPLVITGSSSYSGNTTVNAGTLQMNSANTGNDGSVLTIAAAGATLNLNFTGTDIVNKFFIGSTQMAAGIYKAVGSAAVGLELAKLTGTGTITVAPSATTTTVASSINPVLEGTSVTFTSTVIGNMPTGNVTFYAGATPLGTRALDGSSLASITTNTLAVGTHSITASYVGNLTNSASNSTVMSQVVTPASYKSWSITPEQGLTAGTNNGPMDDPDHDGICNLVEFALGGAPMVSKQSILPKLSKLAGAWVFVYDRSNASLAPVTAQVVQYGNDLTGWVSIPIPATTSLPVTVVPGILADRVSVIIPNVGPKTFVRLKVTQ